MLIHVQRVFFVAMCRGIVLLIGMLFVCLKLKVFALSPHRPPAQKLPTDGAAAAAAVAAAAVPTDVCAARTAPALLVEIDGNCHSSVRAGAVAAVTADECGPLPGSGVGGETTALHIDVMCLCVLWLCACVCVGRCVAQAGCNQCATQSVVDG